MRPASPVVVALALALGALLALGAAACSLKARYECADGGCWGEPIWDGGDGGDGAAGSPSPDAAGDAAPTAG